MTITITHAFVSTVPDDSSVPQEVRPSNWNANHVVTGSLDLVGFVSSLNTTAPNNVVPVAVLMAFDGISETDQVDVAVVPSGVLGSSTTIGAFSLQVPDGTNAGGNKRGISAVDLQLWRNDPSQIASGLSAVAAGSANIASNFGAIALGDANTSTGVRSVAIGEQNTASAGASVALGSANVASGDSAFAMGRINTASGASSVTMGQQNIASNLTALAIGFSNTASGAYSVALGFTNTADGNASRATGNFATTRGILYADVFGAGGALGTFQRGDYCLSAITSDATPLVVLSGLNTTGSPVAPTAFNQVGLPNGANSANGASYIFVGKVVAVDIATGNSSGWIFEGVIKQGATAGTTALVAAVTASLVAQDAALSTTAVAITADAVNGALTVTATGVASTTIQWMCDVQTSETTY